MATLKLIFRTKHNKKGYFALRAGRAILARPYLGRYMHFRYFVSFIFAILSVEVLASDEFIEPMHTSEQIISELYLQSGIDRDKSTIELLRFDYKSQHWHIELGLPESEGFCIDCYPSFSFKNEKPLKLFSIPHG